MRLAEESRGVEIHPARTLYDRFQYQGGYLPAMPLEEAVQGIDGRLVPFLPELHLGLGQEVLYGKGSGEKSVHSCYGVTHRHGVPCVSVISAPDGGEFMFLGFPLRLPVLDGHFHGYLYGYRPRIG